MTGDVRPRKLVPSGPVTQRRAAAGTRDVSPAVRTADTAESRRHSPCDRNVTSECDRNVTSEKRRMSEIGPADIAGIFGTSASGCDKFWLGAPAVHHGRAKVKV